MKKFKNQQGFSLTEMALTLAIVGTLSTLAYNYYARTINDQRRVKEGVELNDFNKSVGNFLATYQSAAIKYTANGAILTISPEKLQAYGYLRKSKLYDKDNKELYPCATIFYENNQLQSFVYFRTDNQKQSNYESKELPPLMKGLKSLGATAGVLLKDNNGYIVKGGDATWKLDNTAINKYFSNPETDFLFDSNPAKCKGAYLASQTYTIYTSNTLSNLTAPLADSQVIKQNMNEIATAGQENKIDTLNMDATNSVYTPYNAIAKNKLIFQSNPDCQMNPSILSTMQDYDPNGDNDGACKTWNPKNISCTGINKPNKYGCRNKQLTLGMENATICSGGDCDDQKTEIKRQINAVVINGFNQVDTSYQNKQKETFLGSLSASTIQATAIVGYGDSCSKSEVGSMAKQKDYSQGTDAVSKLYSLNQNLMVCQKNLLCPQNTGFSDTAQIKTCWLPLKPISAKLTFSTSDKVLSFEAPAGFYIRPDSVVYTENPDKSINNLNNGGKWFGNWQQGNDGGNTNNGKYSRCKGKNVIIDWLDIHVDSSGWFANLNNINSDNIYAPPELLENSTLSPLNGWNTRRDLSVPSFPSFNAGGRSGDTSGKYVTSRGYDNTRSYVSQEPNQKTNWENSKSAFKYRFGGTYPYIANSKWDLRQEIYDANPGNAGNICGTWHEGKIVSFPYYITELVVSNDLSTQTLDNNNPPPAPPIPIPDGDCTPANIPLDIQQNARVAANNWKWDDEVQKQVVLSSPTDGFKITSTKIPSTPICQVKATANYCPSDGEIGCKYTLEYQLANGIQINWNGAWSSGTVARTTLSSGDVVVNRMCNYVGMISMCDNHLPITIGDSGIVDHTPIPIWNRKAGTYSVYHTAGTCQSANLCANPKTINVFLSSYIIGE